MRTVPPSNSNNTRKRQPARFRFESSAAGIGARRGEVHLHVLEFASVGPAVDRLVTFLETAERGGAAAFYFRSDRRRYLLSHAFLRLVLAFHAGGDPRRLRMTAGHRGKPKLTQSCFDFSLAHSRRHAVVAVAHGVTVGADVEIFRNDPDLWAILDHCANEERSAWAAIPQASRPIAFQALWTCKEAVLKAVGLGLSCPLDAFAVTSLTDHPRLLRAPPSFGRTADWRLLTVPLPGQARATVAVRHPAPRLIWHGDRAWVGQRQYLR